MSEASPTADTANAAMRLYWNEVAGPRWVGLGGAQEARNVEVARMLLMRLQQTVTRKFTATSGIFWQRQKFRFIRKGR